MSDVNQNREILLAGQQKGLISTFGAFFRLSGPAWLQSAITLGSGSLGSALYLGLLCGYNMLWLNLAAIVIGVIMLSSISYVVLSTGKRPFQAINQHVNPVLGVGWIVATILANMIWILPQFTLCFDVLDKNLFPGMIEDSNNVKFAISAGLFTLATTMVVLSLKGGSAAKLFDWLLKILVGVIVISFVAVVVCLIQQQAVDWQTLLSGFIPRLEHWFSPTPTVAELIEKTPESVQGFWSNRLLANQRVVMISTTATVVGINMTFLLPYSMLQRGWDRPFRGLAVFDLVTGLAVPFVLATSCIIVASAFSFYAQADENFLSSEPQQVIASPAFASKATDLIVNSHATKEQASKIENLNDQQRANIVASVSKEERILATMLVKPNSGQLAKALEPLLGEKYANLVFGIGGLAMGFSTMVVLMMINALALGELTGRHKSLEIKVIGGILAGIVGVCWPWIWQGQSKTWLIILASTFGAILLPIAYVSFFALMNNRDLLKTDIPTGLRRIVWNILMGVGVLAALAQALVSLYTKLFDGETGKLEEIGENGIVVGGVVTFTLLAIFGFAVRHKKPSSDE